MLDSRNPIVLFCSLALILIGCTSDQQSSEPLVENELSPMEEPAVEEMILTSYLLVTHTITDLEAWKKEFATLKESRQSVGLAKLASFTSFIDSTLVCVLFQTNGSASMLEFASSMDNIEALKRVGATSPPDIKIMRTGLQLNEVEMNSPFYILVQHPVDDFGQWLMIYGQNRKKREQHALMELGVFTQPVDEENVAILLASNSLVDATIYAQLLQSGNLLEVSGVNELPSTYVMVAFDSDL